MQTIYITRAEFEPIFESVPDLIAAPEVADEYVAGEIIRFIEIVLGINGGEFRGSGRQCLAEVTVVDGKIMLRVIGRQHA